MKVKFSAVIVSILLSVTPQAWAGEFSTKLFSLEIPKGMTVDGKDENSISFIFADDADLQKGTLSVSAKTGTDQWQKIKSEICAGKVVLFEKNMNASGITWQIIGARGKSGQFESESIVYYGVAKDATYMLHYHCQQGHCADIAAKFDFIVESFKPK